MLNKWQLLLSFMKGRKRKYIGAIIFTGLSTLISLVAPLVTRTTVDSIIGDQPMMVPEWIADLISSIEVNLYLHIIFGYAVLSCCY